MANAITDLAKQGVLRGTQQHRIAEPRDISTLAPVDNSTHGRHHVTTSIDCYVAGQYIQKGGKTIDVHQRYTIFVRYSASTQEETLRQVRDLITKDFQVRYGGTFNITNVFVPLLPVPTQEIPKSAPLEYYEGSRIFRSMTRTERARYEIGTQKVQSRLNIESIKKRYGVKR